MKSINPKQIQDLEPLIVEQHGMSLVMELSVEAPAL